MKNKICELHRKELLRFLLLKTAAVRKGIKPGELLRVRHCYRSKNKEGFQFCLYRNDILNILQLNYLELRIEEDCSLILFYHRDAMAKTLAKEENLEVLKSCGYPIDLPFEEMLRLLKGRFEKEIIPHEVGIFIGYPAKDVMGFIQKIPRSPGHHGAWVIFGDTKESLFYMNLYRQVEEVANKLLDTCSDLQTFFDQVSTIKINQRRLNHG